MPLPITALLKYYLPYNSGTISSDYLFPNIKNILWERRFISENEIKVAIIEHVDGISKDFYVCLSLYNYNKCAYNFKEITYIESSKYIFVISFNLVKPGIYPAHIVIATRDGNAK